MCRGAFVVHDGVVAEQVWFDGKKRAESVELLNVGVLQILKLSKRI